MRIWGGGRVRCDKEREWHGHIFTAFQFKLIEVWVVITCSSQRWGGVLRWFSPQRILYSKGRLKRESESPGSLVKSQIVSPPPGFLNQ